MCTEAPEARTVPGPWSGSGQRDPPVHGVAVKCLELPSAWAGCGMHGSPNTQRGSGVPGLPKTPRSYGVCRVPQCMDRPWDAWSSSGVQGHPRARMDRAVHGAAPGAGTGFGVLGPRNAQRCTECGVHRISGAWMDPGVHRATLGCQDPTEHRGAWPDPGLCETAPAAGTGCMEWGCTELPEHKWAGTDSCSAQSSPEVCGFSGDTGNTLPGSMNSPACKERPWGARMGPAEPLSPLLWTPVPLAEAFPSPVCASLHA